MIPKIQLQVKQLTAISADVLVVIVDPDDAESNVVQALDEALGGGLSHHLEQAEFEASKGAVIEVPSLGRGPSGRLIFVGVRTQDPGDGARFSARARMTEAVAVGVRTALGSRPASVAVFSPLSQGVRAVSLGAALGAYTFDKYLSDPPRRPSTVFVCVEQNPSAAQKAEFALGLRVGEGVCLARDLINEPPNVLTPKEFSQRARDVAKKNGLKCKILDHEGIKKAKMLLHDAVGKGSENLPYFIHLTYQPKAPKGQPKTSKGRMVFVGKGLTFDSGGLCIKPGPGMLDMKTDMSGGAAVLGMMEAVSALAPDVEVHGIIGAAENMPDAAAYRPSDVLSSLSGKGVEVINTDAEGRLVLADALTYATRLGPDLIVDAATLTGATLLSLGPPYSAFYTNREEIAQAMSECSLNAGESFWRMPLIEELAAQLKSTVTDLKHTGERFGGAITAALFLREFIEGLPWMHCDIPGAVYRDRAIGMHPQGGTGHAVLTFLELVMKHAETSIVKAKPSATTPRSQPGAAKSSTSTKKPVGQKSPSKSSAKKPTAKKPTAKKSSTKSGSAPRSAPHKTRRKASPKKASPKSAS